MEILIHCIYSAFMDIMILCMSSSWTFWSISIVWGDDHTCHIWYHSYSWPLYSYVFGTAVCTCSHVQSLILYYTIGCLVLPPISSSLHFWDGYCNVFRPSCYPSNLTLIGGICYSWFYHTWWITHLWPSLSLCKLFGPHGTFLYLWCFQDHP